MKQILLSCYLCLFIGVALHGQNETKATSFGDNLGLQNQLDLFLDLNENLGQDLQLDSWKNPIDNYLNVMNQPWQRDFVADPINEYSIVAIETETINYRLGPDAFLSPQEAQEIWNDAVSPFNPEHLLIGNQVGGFDLFNNMPILIIRPKIGTFLNEQLLLNWD